MKTAFYDLSVAPVTHDFAVSALKAKKAACDTMVIVPGRRPMRVQHYDDFEVQARIETIFVPILRSLGMTPVLPHTRDEAFRYWQKGKCFPDSYGPRRLISNHLFRSIVPEMPLGIEFNPELATLQRMRQNYEGTVVIHVREQQFQADRNSNVTQWVVAADRIREQGFRVVFVPDFSHLETEFGTHDVCLEAGRLLLSRIALMRVALVNLMIQTGHAVFPLLSSIPGLIFKPVNPHAPATWWVKAGIPAGTQPRWFGPHQRIIWEEDEARIIVPTFMNWCHALAETMAH